MTAFNAVRFRVKSGMEKAFEDGHRNVSATMAGLLEAALVKTGDRSYCFIGKWKSMDDIAAARPEMIGMLDRFRPMLEDLGGGLGLTDPVSGTAVVQIR